MTLKGPVQASGRRGGGIDDQNLADVVGHTPGGPRTGSRRASTTLERASTTRSCRTRGDTFIGAPGAILDGQHANRYAFGGDAADVTIKFLTVQNFGSAGDNNNEGVVNHDSAEGWTVDSSTIQKNAGAGVMLGSGAG